MPRLWGNIKKMTPEIIQKISAAWKKTFDDEKKISFKTVEDIKTYVKSKNIKKTWEALPICFDENYYWKCYFKDFYDHGKGYCYNTFNCRLLSDKESDKQFLKECFEQTVKALYDWRSKFLHEAKLPPIREVAMVEDIYKKKPIVVTLTTTQLKPMFERMLLNYFVNYQKPITKDDLAKVWDRE
jgi:hypothetical protein